MVQQLGILQTLTGGISTISKKLGPPNSVAWERSINFRSDPGQQTTYAAAKKISGSIVTDLPMFGDVASGTLYMHGNTGNIYKVDASDTVTKDYTVPNSSGNGIVYFGETNQLYIPTNTSITRKDIATGNYYNNFLETSGGAPTNTNALSLVAASSQSATRADTASLSITGNMTLEAYLKPTSLPTGTNKMTIISKWDETTSAGKLSYKLDIIATAASFGDGSDGSLTISVDTTDSPIDSACTGTANTYTLSATNASFAAGQVVLIHQSQGTNAGQYEINTIQSYTAGTITLTNKLAGTYTTGAQVLVMKQYTDVTINSGKTWTAKAWNGTTGGILTFLADGTITIAGTISASLCGFRGGAGVDQQQIGKQGEGTSGPGGTQSTATNGNGGGGGYGQGGTTGTSGGGGGGNSSSGGNGSANSGVAQGTGGIASGSSDLTTMVFGGGGGSGGTNNNSGTTLAPGGNGGGIIFLNGTTFTMSGSGFIVSNGADGLEGETGSQAGSGGGAGGSILIKAQTATLGNGQIIASGGAGGPGNHSNGGGSGSSGRIDLNYYTSYTGTTTPTLNAIQDSSLAVSNGNSLRLYISDDGAAYETYDQDISDFTGTYKFYSVSWQASTSTANFYENAQLIGTKTGSKTSINDNTSIFGIGCYENSSGTKTGFYDGLIDDVRVWSDVRTAQEIAAYYQQILAGTEDHLVAYYKFDGDVTDSQTSGLNNLTANNSPTYSTDVAFFGVTTRGDEDVFANHTGQSYTLKTALSETSTDKIPFTPTKEPFKSLALDVGATGSGNWTVTVHDELNVEVATMTVAHADMATGIYEFKFANSERIVLNASYHIHVYDTTGDGTLVTGTASDASTAWLKTYFQILVNDQYHMAVQFQNFVCIANERYLATLQAGNVYNPARLIFPSGYRMRSLAFWQQYIVIGMWFGTSITDTDTGKLFFWDGESDTYVDSLDIPQGGINAMLGTQGGLLISAGYKGAMLEYTGYPSSFRYTARTAANIAFRMPNVSQGDTVEIAPGALAMWNGMNRIGASLNLTSSTFHQGIYSYGQYTDQDPMSVGFDNPLSIGDTTSTSVKIGCLKTRDAKLYAGWQNGISYGIDVVDESNDPYPTATIEFLITDLGSVAAENYPLVFRSDFEALTSGQSVTLKYKANRESAWHTLGTQSTAGATYIRGRINQRVNEIQFATDIVNTTDSVVLLQHTLESENASDERQA